jgi:hypothetical protein
MQEKRNKGKLKREAKDVAKQAKRMQGVKVIMPVGQPSIHPSILARSFGQNQENPNALNKMAVSLTRLRIHAGDEDDMSLMYSRVMFGRRLAHLHFDDDQIAENLHHAVQTIVLAYQDQWVEGQDKQVMSLDGEAGEEISEALHTIEEMAKQLDIHTYQRELIVHASEVNNIDAEMHLQSWEEYVASVGHK